MKFTITHDIKTVDGIEVENFFVITRGGRYYVSDIMVVTREEAVELSKLLKEKLNE